MARMQPRTRRSLHFFLTAENAENAEKKIYGHKDAQKTHNIFENLEPFRGYMETFSSVSAVKNIYLARISLNNRGFH